MRRTNCIAPLLRFPDRIISIGESIPDSSVAKNRCSCDEWKDLSCIQEYREK